MRSGPASMGLGMAALLSAAISGSAQAAINETHVYGIANFGHSGECTTDTGLTHPVHTTTAAKFANHFSDLRADNLWDDVQTRNNTSARGSYWTDASKADDCNCTADDEKDKYGADDADVLYIHTHGGHHQGVDSYLLMGNGSYDCYAYTTENMLFNSDLQIAVVKACQSGNYDVWLGRGYGAQFNETASPFTMWNAFHGDSSCGSNVTSYVDSYVKESDFNGVGENWLDEAYDYDSGSNDDDCPVSILFGALKADRELMFTYGGWKDRKDTGDKTGASTYFYIGGCDPSNGDPLPNS